MSKINANAFIGHLLFLILVVQLVEIRSTTSMPPFYGHIICVCLVSFVHHLWLTLHHARCLGQQHSFCRTSYQCAIQEEFFLWLSKTLRTDLLSLFSKLLISFGILLRSNRIVSTMFIFFLNAHWAMIYTIYKVLYIFVCPRNAIFFIVCFWWFSGIWECMIRIRHNSIT